MVQHELSMAMAASHWPPTTGLSLDYFNRYTWLQREGGGGIVACIAQTGIRTGLSRVINIRAEGIRRCKMICGTRG